LLKAKEGAESRKEEEEAKSWPPNWMLWRCDCQLKYLGFVSLKFSPQKGEQASASRLKATTLVNLLEGQ